MQSPLHHRVPARLLGLLCGLTLWLGSHDRAAAELEAHELVLDVPAGTVLKYRLDSRSDGKQADNTFANTIAASAEVERLAEPQNANLAFEVRFVKVQATARQGTESAPQELGLNGVKARVEVTAAGRVVRVEPRSPVTEMQQQLLENFANAFFLELPAKPVKRGDTWKIELSQASGGSGSGDYKLERLTRGRTPSGRAMHVAHLTGTLRITSTTPPLQGSGQVAAEIAVPGGYLLGSKGSVALTGQGSSIVQSYDLKLVP